MERKIGETVYIMANNLNTLEGVVTDKKLEGDHYKYIVKFKVKDENGEYETSSPCYEWELFCSEEECLQHEYDREKAYIDSAQSYLNQVKEKLDKIKGATCRNCINFCPTCKRCGAEHPAIAENMIDKIDLVECCFYKRKGN